MGYKIWRKDHLGWSLAYDTIFDTRESVDEQINTLNAKWDEKVKHGELEFHPYRDDIKLDTKGNIIDSFLNSSGKKNNSVTKKRKNIRY